MLVRVRYASGAYDYVNSNFLDDLIQNNAICQFFRSGSWATIGIDPIRGASKTAIFAGPERRGMQGALALGLGRPYVKKLLCTLLVLLTFTFSMLFGTVLSAMFLQPVDDLEDTYSQAEMNGYTNNLPADRNVSLERFISLVPGFNSCTIR
jgi:hypothetical protein